ncbi:N2,N2-dimethylguanosine tRNA methyltransferase [Sulfolobus acidocaldarius SUSAZ]|nr:N2,N2-dimethylguanosine tRNA methyltransferase [Sulfolobus acidocaldarius SUSAZ]
MSLVEIIEGKARILIPNYKDYMKDGKFDPSWAPVFYNPKMILNRDLSVLVANVVKPKSLIDGLSATGVRGIRYGLEINGVEEIILNDIDSDAVELIKKNVKINDLESRAKIYNKNINSLLYEIKVDYVDIDPFGSPAPFLLSSFSAAKSKQYVAITATDLAALMCSSKTSARRKYGLICNKMSFSRELGLRGLISKAITEAAVVEKAVTPVFSFYNDYYYRVIFKVERGAKKVDRQLSKLVYYYECPKCGYRIESEYLQQMKCPDCNLVMQTYGPAYKESLVDYEFLNNMISELDKFNYFQTFNKLKSILLTIKDESKYNENYYRIDFLASLARVNVPRRNNVINCLAEASRTHLDPLGVKTSKNIDEIKECIKKLSGRNTN